MKAILWLLLAWLIPACTLPGSYHCTFENGDSVKVKYSCEPAMVKKFEDRLVDLYPIVRDQWRDHEEHKTDLVKDLYIFALVGCEESARNMTPEEIGKNSEPFFPWQMMAAMTQAARDVACTDDN